MRSVVNWFIFLYLSIASIQDMRKKRIPINYMILGGIFMVIVVLQIKNISMIDRMVGACIGGLFFVVSKVTKEAIGKADCILILYLGVVMGFTSCITTLFISFFFCSIFCMVLLGFRIANRKKRIAYIPFLTLGFLCSLWII